MLTISFPFFKKKFKGQVTKSKEYWGLSEQANDTMPPSGKIVKMVAFRASTIANGEKIVRK
jgi:hypothetical protein